MKTALIATRNQHKLEEIQSLLGIAFRVLSLRDVGETPDVVEDAATFEGNALKKAEALAEWLAQTRNADRGSRNEISLVLADDSGLEVDALEGEPGVHSARFAALDTGVDGNAGDVDNNAKLLRLLRDVPLERRTARFRCVLALVSVGPNSAEPNPRTFAGSCEGRIGFELRGEHGFGYDPLFVPDGFEETFAELGDETKNRISHRAKALAKLVEWLDQARNAECGTGNAA
jgi:XTP/dITP diphosphohydrolase